MALKTMIDELNAARRAYDEKKNAIGKDARAAVGAFLGPLIPPGYVVQWTQYAPHFNDGDACTFSVHEPNLVREGATTGRHRGEDGMTFGTARDRYGKPDETKSYETEDHDAYGWLPYAERRRIDALPYGESRAARPKKTVSYVEEGFPAIEGYDASKLDELAAAWCSLPEDFMEQAFGEDALVTVDSSGVSTVDSYDHN